MLKFDATPEDRKTIIEIAKRAEALLGDPDGDCMATIMDIVVTHSNVPLRLEEFLAADDFNFAYDVLGIRRHLNRRTGDLEDCFLPRFAK